MIEETEELECPICAGVLRHSLFERGAFWECENCESIWNATELIEEMRDTAQSQPPRPESNFL
jgi:ribosomal protein L37AE/L43A